MFRHQYDQAEASNQYQRSYSAPDTFSKETRNHLKNVYGTVALTTGAAALGSFCFLTMPLFQSSFISLLTMIGTFGLIFAILGSSAEGPTDRRLGMLALFGFLIGVSSGPLIALAAMIDSSLIFVALLGATVIFGSFSAAALFAEKRSYLYLGGALGSSLSFMLMMSFVNMFFGSLAIANAQLYFGFVIFAVFVLYDTQKIVTKAEAGDRDYIAHALDLFLDLANLFRHLLVILMKNKAGGEKEDKKNKRR